MDTYLYINDRPMDFVCNGVPSHLQKGMKVKERLVEYMLTRHPNSITKIEDGELRIQEAVKFIPKVIKHEEVKEASPVKEVNLEVIDKFFSENSNKTETKAEAKTEEVKETETVKEDIYAEVELEPEDKELADAMDKIKGSKNKKFSLKKLKKYSDVNFRNKEEIDSICSQLSIEYTTKKATVKAICAKLEIPV
jgi:hypothetical protein